jgi:hypothetical protein
MWRLMAEGATLRVRAAARMELRSATAAKYRKAVEMTGWSVRSDFFLFDFFFQNIINVVQIRTRSGVHGYRQHRLP